MAPLLVMSSKIAVEKILMTDYPDKLENNDRAMQMKDAPLLFLSVRAANKSSFVSPLLSFIRYSLLLS